MLQKMPFTKVELTGGLLKELNDTIRTAALPAQYEKCRTTGRLDAFKLQEREGCGKIHIFWDSDTAKWMEGAAYSLAQHPDPDLERKLDAIIRDMKSCQEPDGYLNTHYTKYGLENRWTSLRDAHELYCAGHLMATAWAEDPAPWADVLYAPRRSEMTQRNITTMPYFLWGNRSPGEMNVFLGKCN